MLNKKTPLIIGAGLLVVGASVSGAVSANAADDRAPTTSSNTGAVDQVPAQDAGSNADAVDSGWTMEQDGMSISGAPGTEKPETAPAEAAH